MELLSANFDKTMAKNENFKLYDGIYEGLGPCTILVLYNIEKNIDVFYKISNQINIFSNLNYTYLAKLWGIIVDKEKFCLIFEKLTSSLDSRLKTKSIEETTEFFKTHNIDIRPFFYPIHKHGHLTSIKNDDEISELLNKEIIMIPSSPSITIEEQTYVVNIIKLFIDNIFL
jgi:hypothetical protein